MATLVNKLILSSLNSSSDALNLTISNALTTTLPHQGLTRQTITTADDQEIVSTASGIYYVYVKNLDTTNFVVLQTVASVQWGRLSKGEFAFFAVNDGAGLELRADTASCNVEYAYWKKG
jgi:hypothetical protein